MSPRRIVGIRTERHGSIHFAWSNVPDLELLTPVVADISGHVTLGYVALPSRLIIGEPEFAVHGRVVAAGLEDPIVQHAFNILEQETITESLNFAGPSVDIQAASWSIDRARLDLTLGGPMATSEAGALGALRLALAIRFRSEVRFRRPDGTLIELSPE
jgi:hypothetical protein